MTKTEALLPCPFCGGEAELREGEECAYVQCLHASYHKGPFCDGDNNAAEEAIKAWNTRTPECQTEEALLPIIAEMKAIVEREKDASGHVSRKSVAKYFQAFVTKLEQLPRTHEGQEIPEVCTCDPHWLASGAMVHMSTCPKHVLVTKKED